MSPALELIVVLLGLSEETGVFEISQRGQRRCRHQRIRALEESITSFLETQVPHAIFIVYAEEAIRFASLFGSRPSFLARMPFLRLVRTRPHRSGEESMKSPKLGSSVSFNRPRNLSVRTDPSPFRPISCRTLLNKGGLARSLPAAAVALLSSALPVERSARATGLPRS